jgi:hypothetical protein
MDEVTHAEIESIKGAVERLEGMVQRLLDREENRISRITEIELAMEKFRGECAACRERVDTRLSDGNGRFIDHETRLKSLENPETGAVRKGDAGKARDNLIRWIELGKAVVFAAGFCAVIYALIRKG